MNSNKKSIYPGKKKIKFSRIILVIASIFVVGYLIFMGVKKIPTLFKTEMEYLIGMNVEQVESYAKKNKLEINYLYEYTTEEDKGLAIKQSIKTGTEINQGDPITITFSKGELDLDEMKELGVNELGKIPVVMYHGIQNITNSQTASGTGNIDRQGYNRTAEAFRKDLEMFYELGYRPISLNDYVTGNIDLPLGLSPIVFTFDDGLQNNFNVLGKDKDGNLEIDPNSAIGIMEEFNEKYPDFNITATFFLNGDFFGQKEYEAEKLQWLVDNGYDVGNHTWGHPNLAKIDINELQKQIGMVNQKINEYLPDYKITSFALPFGSHPDYQSDDYNYIFEGSYEGVKYDFDAVLAVGWQPDRSPYATMFKKSLSKSPNLIMRVRGSDKVGNDQWTDLNWIFNQFMPSQRYVSDGDIDSIVIPSALEEFIDQERFPNLEVYSY